MDAYVLQHDLNVRSGLMSLPNNFKQAPQYLESMLERHFCLLSFPHLIPPGLYRSKGGVLECCMFVDGPFDSPGKAKRSYLVQSELH